MIFELFSVKTVSGLRERFENTLKNYGVLGKMFFSDEIFKLFVHNVLQNFPGICSLSDRDVKIEKFPKFDVFAV